MSVSHVYDEVSKCSRCGYCQPACPTYSVSGLEQEVARGRNSIVRAVIEGRLDFSKDLKQSIFQCLMCGACSTNCFPGIRTDEIMAAARHEYITRYGQPQLQRYIFKDLLRKPDTLTRFVRLASFGKRFGISGLVNVLRILGWFGKNVANAEGLLEQIPKSFLRDRINQSKMTSSERVEKVAYFVGCGMNFAYPDVGEATIYLVQRLKCEVEILPNYCCGLPAYAYGDLDSVQWFAEQNSTIMNATDADVILTDCGSCTSFLHEYPRLLKKSSEFSEIAKSVSNRVQDITTWITTHLDSIHYDASHDERVTYHDPCHLAHYLTEREPARQILQSLPGVQYIELPEADWCCGGAGSYNITNYDVSMKILERKMDNVKETDATILVTACPSCLIQLSYGTRRYNLPITVKHVSELVWERLSM